MDNINSQVAETTPYASSTKEAVEDAKNIL